MLIGCFRTVCKQPDVSADSLLYGKLAEGHTEEAGFRGVKGFHFDQGFRGAFNKNDRLSSCTEITKRSQIKYWLLCRCYGNGRRLTGSRSGGLLLNILWIQRALFRSMRDRPVRIQEHCGRRTFVLLFQRREDLVPGRDNLRAGRVQDRQFPEVLG